MRLPTNLKKDALFLVEKGWFVIPLCWPDPLGRCACGKSDWHQGREGKVPLITGYTQERGTAKDVKRWWGRWPLANIGILLEPSNLLLIDADSSEAVVEARDLGLPPTLTVKTPKGYHWYYERPESWTVARVTQKGESKGIDVLSKGFSVAPCSYHRRGRHYAWDSDPNCELAYPPHWAKKLLPKKPWLLDGKHLPKQYPTSHDPLYTTQEKLTEALRFLEPENYDVWLQVGMALKSWDDNGNGEGKGFQLWDTWSQRSAKYPGLKRMTIKWESFAKRTGVGLGTLYSKAKENGWNSAASQGKKKMLGSWYSH